MFISATIEIELQLGETMDDGQRVDWAPVTMKGEGWQPLLWLGSYGVESRHGASSMCASCRWEWHIRTPAAMSSSSDPAMSPPLRRSFSCWKARWAGCWVEGPTRGWDVGRRPFSPYSDKGSGPSWLLVHAATSGWRQRRLSGPASKTSGRWFRIIRARVEDFRRGPIAQPTLQRYNNQTGTAGGQDPPARQGWEDEGKAWNKVGRYLKMFISTTIEIELQMGKAMDDKRLTGALVTMRCEG